MSKSDRRGQRDGSAVRTHHVAVRQYRVKQTVQVSIHAPLSLTVTQSIRFHWRQKDSHSKRLKKQTKTLTQ